MFEVVLQHCETGRFLGEKFDWKERSRDALTFANTDLALRFARSAALGKLVLAVARFHRDNHYILLPLLDTRRVARPACGQAIR